MQDGNMAASVTRKPLVHDIACALGLSILFPYFRGFFLSIVKSAGIHSTAAFEGSFYAFAVAFALCAAVVLVAGPRLARMAPTRKTLVATGICGTIGTALLWVPAPGSTEVGLCVVGASANVVFFIACLLSYLKALEGFEARRATLVVTLGFGLCFASNLLYLLPLWVQAAACSAAPLVAAACAPLGRVREISKDTVLIECGAASVTGSTSLNRDDAVPMGEGLAVGREPAAFMADTAPTRPTSSAPLALCVLLALFCVLGNFIRGITNPWFDISGITVRTLYMSLVNVALVAGTVALLLKKASLNRVVFLNWVVYMLMFFGGVLVMAVAPADVARMGSNLATSARVGFTMLLVLFVIAPERWPGMPLARRAGLFLLMPEALAALVRYIAVPAYLSGAQGQRAALMTYAGTAVVFVLAAAIVIMLGSLLLRSSQSGLAGEGAETGGTSTPAATGPTDPHVSLTAAVAARESLDTLVADELARRYTLTPREADVLRCASQGHSLEKTAELLGVSVNTVRTHNRSVYAKTGVHSRQEIIELARATRAELAGEVPTKR